MQESGSSSLHATLRDDRDSTPNMQTAANYKLTPNVGRRVTEPDRQGQALYFEKKSEYNNSSKMLKPVTFH
jgi:hypothetical protein